MSRKHPLDGLIKWAQGGQWREAFEETLMQHFGSACDDMDVELGELQDLLEPIDFVIGWTCAFEDLLSKDIDGENLTDDYLKRRGWKESATSRAYLRALRKSVPSLYEISGVRLEEGFFLRDLIRGGEPVWVHEKPRTRGAVDGDRIAVRVVTVNSRFELGDALLPFDERAADELAAELLEVSKATPEDMAQAFAEAVEESGEVIDEEMQEALDALREGKIELTLDEALASSAFLFTTHYIREKLGDRTERPSSSSRQASAPPLRDE
jgi:hypothetical protein